MFYNCGPQGEADACDAGNLATCAALNGDLAEIAVYCANEPGGTAEVGSKRHPNAWGLHDPLRPDGAEQPGHRRGLTRPS